jgi:hypothetical protein
VLLLAQVVALAHLVLVEHRTCAQHGETIHAAPAPARTEPGPANAVAVQSVNPTAADDHDHCLCMAPGRERFALLAPSHDGWGACPPAATCQIPIAVGPAPSIALLDLAPKGSPPA